MSEIATYNLLDSLPAPQTEESVDVLVKQDEVRIERIVSHGHSSPPGFWYDQPEEEWVTVLSGKGKLLFEHESDLIELGPGDSVVIPAHRRHRVESTCGDTPTVWLAVFYKCAIRDSAPTS